MSTQIKTIHQLEKVHVSKSENSGNVCYSMHRNSLKRSVIWNLKIHVRNVIGIFKKFP